MINNPNSDSLFKSQYYWMNLPGTLSVSNGILTLTGEWIDMYRLNHAYIQLYLKSGSGTSIDSAVCLLHINYVIASGAPSWGLHMFADCMAVTAGTSSSSHTACSLTNSIITFPIILNIRDFSTGVWNPITEARLNGGSWIISLTNPRTI